MRKPLALLLIAIGAVWVIPAYLTLQTSFMSAFTSPLNLIHYAHLRNWQLLPWSVIEGWLFNSVVVCVSVSCLSTFVAISAGYGFIRYDFRGKENLFHLFLLAMAMPGIVLFLPRYLLVAGAGLINTYPGLILPMILIPSSVFFARQFLAQVDVSIIEAARLDGASEIRIFWSLILPLSKPLIAICFLAGFGASYGNFMWQYLAGRELLTLTAGIGLFLQGVETMTLVGGYGLFRTYAVSIESLKAAASVLQAIPLILLFAVGQKYLVEGTVI